MELDVENNGNDNSLKVIQTSFSKTDKTILFPYIESTYLKKDDTKLHTKIKTQIITENKPSLNICNYKTINFTGDDIETCCLDTFERLKSYTNSDGGTLYLADDNTLQRVIQNNGAITHGMKLQIITGTNVASYVADVGKYLCLNSIVDIREDQRFPLGTAPYDGTVNSVLCLPAITSFGRLIAVFEFVRLHELDYTKNDVAFAQGMINWFTDAIAKKYNRIKYNEDVSNEFHDLLLRIFRLYSSHEMDYDSLVSEIMMRTRDYIRAREIQYYIPVNKEKRELYLYEEGIIGKRRLYRKKLPVQLEDDLVLAYVWENNQYLNVAGKNLKKFDIKNAKIKSMLCVPVGSKNNVVAIVKAINKFKGRFKVEDAVELRHSAIFCALAYKQHLARDNYRIMEKVVKNEQKRVIHYSQPCEHDIDTFLSQVFKTPLPKNITKFTWYPNENDLGLLLEYSWWMFRHLFKNELFFGKIAAFLLAVRHGYRKKPYHNFEHAFGMMHIIFVILHLHSKDFSMFEKTCLMIASICHDIHHPGVSNTFLRLSKNPLAELYEESTLENYHSYMTRLLLDHYGLFSYLPSSEYLRYKKEIHELILYTDLDIAITTKFPLARQLINDNNYDDKKHRYLLKSLIMNSADLAGQSKSLDFSGRITALWKNELHIERDKYKRLGITPDRRNDRACAKQIPDDQVNFLKYVCENCSDLLSRLLPNVRPLYKQFKHVRKEWQEHTIPIFQDVQQYYQ